MARDHQHYVTAAMLGPTFLAPVCPVCGISAILVFSYVNTSAMNLHLAQISRHVAQDAHAVIAIDSAA